MMPRPTYLPNLQQQSTLGRGKQSTLGSTPGPKPGPQPTGAVYTVIPAQGLTIVSAVAVVDGKSYNMAVSFNRFRADLDLGTIGSGSHSVVIRAALFDGLHDQKLSCVGSGVLQVGSGTQSGAPYVARIELNCGGGGGGGGGPGPRPLPM